MASLTSVFEKDDGVPGPHFPWARINKLQNVEKLFRVVNERMPES